MSNQKKSELSETIRREGLKTFLGILVGNDQDTVIRQSLAKTAVFVAKESVFEVIQNGIGITDGGIAPLLDIDENVVAFFTRMLEKEARIKRVDNNPNRGWEVA